MTAFIEPDKGHVIYASERPINLLSTVSGSRLPHLAPATVRTEQRTH